MFQAEFGQKANLGPGAGGIKSVLTYQHQHVTSEFTEFVARRKQNALRGQLSFPNRLFLDLVMHSSSSLHQHPPDFRCWVVISFSVCLFFCFYLAKKKNLPHTYFFLFISLVLPNKTWKPSLVICAYQEPLPETWLAFSVHDST